MRILFAVHYYLPRHQAGTELYTRSLVRKFSKEGHQVWVFTSEDQAGPAFKFDADEYEGVRVFRIYHSTAPDFSSSYERPEFDRIFGQVLDEIKPELVHFQHLYRLSAGFVRETKARGIPSLLTLADYWLICPAIIMLKPEDQVCPGPDQGRACANCPHVFAAFSPDQSSTLFSWFWKSLEFAISYGHKLKRQLPPSLVDSLRSAFGKKAGYAEKLALIDERRKQMQKVIDDLSLLISPSRFLREMLIKSAAVPKDKIIYSDYGFEIDRFVKRERGSIRDDGTVVVGFIGTLVKHKGVATLLHAMRALPGKKIELKIFGETRDFPGYFRSLKKLAGKDQRIKWMGRIEHDRVGEAFEEIDVLVVPSLWYENSPLTIHEAFIARVPVIASDIGGMKELIQSGGGILFGAGNANDLAEKLDKLVQNPSLLDQLKKSIPRVKTIDQNYQELLTIYQQLAEN